MTKKDYNSIEATNVAKVEEPRETEQVSTKENEERLKKKALVTTKGVNKRNFMSRVSHHLFKNSEGAGGYVVKEVIFPTMKDGLFNALTTFASMMFYGDDRVSSSRSRRSRNEWTDYNRPSRTTMRASYSEPRGGRGSVRGGRRDYPGEDIIDVPEYLLETRDDANIVISQLQNDIDRFGQASIADYLDYVGGENSNYINNIYGWLDLHTARPRAVRGGYIIDLPPADVL